MTLSMPLITAIVSTYNSEHFIRGCLEDLENQTIAHRLEIIVVNSGSSQNEDAVVEEFQQKYDNIVYIKTAERETIYKAWNRAVKAARGKFITNANTDDRHKEDAFEVMVEVLEKNRGIDLVYAWLWLSNKENETYSPFIELDPNNWEPRFRARMEKNLVPGDGADIGIREVTRHGKTGYVFKFPEFSENILRRQCMIGPQPMWRKNIHERLGLFDQRYESAGDYEFWLRMMTHGCRFKLIPRILGVFYVSGSNKEYEVNTKRFREDLLTLETYFFDFSFLKDPGEPENLDLKAGIKNNIRQYPEKFLRYCDLLSKTKREQELKNILDYLIKKTGVTDIFTDIEHPDNLFELARIVKNAGLTENAEFLFLNCENQTRCKEKLPEIYFHLGDIFSSRNIEKCQSYLKKSLQTYESRERNTLIDRYRMASIYKRLKEWGKAEEIFLKVARDSTHPPLKAGAFFHVGEMYLDREDLNKSEYYFKLCLENHPKHQKAAGYLFRIKGEK